MKQQFTAETSSDPYDSMKVIKDSVNAFNQMMLKASEDLQKIQSASGTSTVLDSLKRLSPFMSVAGPQHFAWQIPTLYQTQSERMLQTLLELGGVISRSQQGFFELAAQSLSRTVQQTVKAMTKVNETVASRRVSAEVIDFTDRRAKAQAVLKHAEDAPEEQTSSYSVARKTNG